MAGPLQIPPELESVAQQVGEFMEYWGFKNVHGRIWTHLFLASEPLDASDLIQRLGVSKALISMSISDLLEYDVIRVAGRGAHGTVTYTINGDVTTVIKNVLRLRERRMLSRISAAVRLLSDLPTSKRGSVDLNDSHLRSLNEMVRAAETTLDGMLHSSEVSFECWNEFTHLTAAENEPTPPKVKKP